MQSFIKNLQQVDLTLHDEASRNWAEIAREDYMFDMKKRMVEKYFRLSFSCKLIRLICHQFQIILLASWKLNANVANDHNDSANQLSP